MNPELIKFAVKLQCKEKKEEKIKCIYFKINGGIKNSFWNFFRQNAQSMIWLNKD